MRGALFLVVLLCLSLLGCDKKESGQRSDAAADSAAQAVAEPAPGMMPPADVVSRPGSEAVPPPTQPPAVEGVFVNVYFDEAGTKSEIALQPGEHFSINVFAETIEPYRVNGTCFRLQVPPGVRVLGTAESPERRLTFGSWDFCYMITYECKPPGRHLAVAYLCMIEPGCRGGKVEVLPGFMAEERSFLGFSTCDDFKELWATGGNATITMK